MNKIICENKSHIGEVCIELAVKFFICFYNKEHKYYNDYFGDYECNIYCPNHYNIFKAELEDIYFKKIIEISKEKYIKLKIIS